jgi:hypothetical protein
MMHGPYAVGWLMVYSISITVGQQGLWQTAVLQLWQVNTFQASLAETASTARKLDLL